MAAKTTSGSGFQPYFLFSALDLVDVAKNRKNFSGALFEIFEVKVEKNQTIFYKVTYIPFSRFFLIFCGCCGTLLFCKFHSLSSSNRLSTGI